MMGGGMMGFIGHMSRLLYPALLVLILTGSVLVAGHVPALVDGCLRPMGMREQSEALCRQCRRELQRLQKANPGRPEDQWLAEHRLAAELARYHLARLGEKP
jgi:hypothetical protein